MSFSDAILFQTTNRWFSGGSDRSKWPFSQDLRKVMGQKQHCLIPLGERLHGTARTVMRQKTVCFLLPSHGSLRAKWSHAAWKIYVAGPEN